MGKRILILQGHPDAQAVHYGHALAEAYEEAARAAGHTVRHIEIARLDVPLLGSKAAFEHAPLPPSLAEAQAALAWAEHVLIVFPLWLGTLPALLKAFFEQVLRPGFAFHAGPGGRLEAALRGRSARLVVTMGMPALIYRWFFRGHGVHAVRRNILRFVGFSPVRTTLIGAIEAADPAARGRWLGKLAAFGRAGN